MSEVAPLISDLAFILVIAGIVTVVFKWLKQPVILGYIVAGIIAGPSITFLPTVTDSANIQTWADIGVIFLLFAMGLDFSFKKLMNVGMTAVIAAITVVCGMMFIGYTAGNAMGFSHMSSIFLGGMLSMSSTAIVFKAFSDMGLMQQKFTGIVLGILVVEDLVAVVMMVILSTLAVSKHFEGAEMLDSIMKLAAFLIVWSVLGIYLIPTFIRRIRSFVSDETLLILSLGLCLGMVMIAVKAGFSSALGAFVMGSLLAETVESGRIIKIVQPVKDLFGAIFFISVGMMVDPAVIWHYALPILGLTLLVLVGQSFFGSFGVLLSGQPLKIAIKSGFSLTQVGEFAFIIASLGVSLNVTDQYLYPVIVAVSVITTFLTPYMIRLSDPVCSFIESRLPQSAKDLIDRYTSGTVMTRHESAWHKLLKSMILSVALCLVLCSFFITIFFTYVEPYISGHLPGIWGDILSFAIISVALSPLLLAIIKSKNNSHEFHELWGDNLFNRGALVSAMVVRVIICVIIVMGLIVRIFSVALGVGVVISLAVIVLIYFSKWIRHRSMTMQQQFIANFEGSDDVTADTGMSGVKQTFRDNGPFKDLHQAEFTISPSFRLVGRTIAENEIRTIYHINILAITRGGQCIMTPQGSERLYPYDRLTVMGTDDDLTSFRNFLQDNTGKQQDDMPRTPVMKLEAVTLDAGTPLIGQTIRQADLQGCIVVGIERAGSNIVNPAPATTFADGDIVWLVGKKDAVRRIANPSQSRRP
ncbi:MAG TPA: cation:proton antiporter [Candidatus Avibacteroides avistercoris]|uniref:Cation:proton antiporter n=1 Tax=Candidatus Avibacteroides avistercoris TaxID=2840690 RepID=A0A9D2ZV40_9BACT|nr:cation:proton antiporter [Candidatus Avibacteroides avistercoris]